jgi:uncharacterized protein GlcG (DUF336 family)
VSLLKFLTPVVTVGVLFSSHLFAAPVVLEGRLMTLELAADIARATARSCNKEGYQVSVVVVDRSATPQVVMRNGYASRFNTEIAERKANAVILAGGIPTSELKQNIAGILAEINEVDGILVLDGAVPIQAGGTLLGAVGVSGAPGGDRDEACARAGVESVQEQLDFLD